MLFHFPYSVKLYRSPYYNDDKPQVTSTGLVDWEFDDEQMALLNNEKGNPKGKYTKWFLECITDCLQRDMKERLEQERGMGDYAPPVSACMRTFVRVTPTKVTLRGTPATWQTKQGKINFTGKVEFCVTTDM